MESYGKGEHSSRQNAGLGRSGLLSELCPLSYLSVTPADSRAINLNKEYVQWSASGFICDTPIMGLLYYSPCKDLLSSGAVRWFFFFFFFLFLSLKILFVVHFYFFNLSKEWYLMEMKSSLTEFNRKLFSVKPKNSPHYGWGFMILQLKIYLLYIDYLILTVDCDS